MTMKKLSFDTMDELEAHVATLPHDERVDFHRAATSALWMMPLDQLNREVEVALFDQYDAGTKLYVCKRYTFILVTLSALGFTFLQAAWLILPGLLAFISIGNMAILPSLIRHRALTLRAYYDLEAILKQRQHPAKD